MPKDYFYESHIWSRLRYLAMRRDQFKCQACGVKRNGGAVLHVDHIKPRSKYPHLELELSNLQTLCASCNLGKSDKFEDNFIEMNSVVRQSAKTETRINLVKPEDCEPDSVEYYFAAIHKKLRSNVKSDSQGATQ